MTFKQKIGITTGIILGIIIVLYAIFRLHDLLFGIRIEVNGITDGMVVTEPKIVISGIAKKASLLTLNGNEVFISKDGEFSEPLVLLPGENVVLLYVKDKFGKDENREYRILYTPLVVNQ